MNEQENPEQQEELSSEERFKQTIDKLRPYILNLRAARWKLLTVNGIVLILTLAYLLFLTKPYYTSTVTILPDYGGKESSLNQLSSLASLAGVSVGTGSPTEIYQNLINSESVLSSVIYSKYKTDKFPDSVNLITYFDIKPDESLTPELQKRKMFLTEFQSLVQEKLSTDVDKLTKVLTVTAIMPEAQLSAEVANKVVKSLDDYIRTKRKSYSSEQRQYIEKRLAQVKDSLTNNENKLKVFKENNRLINQSPALILEQERLTRQVQILNTVYLELSKQLELAKIDEVKDTPVINIKEFAKDPMFKSGPKRLNALVIIMFFSLLLTVGYFIFSGTLRKYLSYIK